MIPMSSLALLADISFEKAATPATIVFQVLVLAGALAGCWVLSRLVDKLWLRLLATGTAVFIFELFTGPMWINERLGPWAYVYLDISWVLTVGWTVLILGVVVLTDRYLPQWSEKWRFPVYLTVLLALVVILEIVVVNIGIRGYAPEVLAATSGVRLAGAPVEILFYVPVFTSLVITFYKYWSFVIDDVTLIPVKKRKWGRAIVIAFIGVFFFEIMIEPMIENRHFPRWSYVYHDISIIMTGVWVVGIAIGTVVVDRYFQPYPGPVRFLVAILLIGALALPIESWLALNGYRVYGPSMVERFTGFRTPITGVATEVAFAIPCYLSLIIAFIRYWEIVLDNRM